MRGLTGGLYAGAATLAAPVLRHALRRRVAHGKELLPRLPEREGIERYAYAMVPTDSRGVVVHDDWDALGMRASGSNSVTFDGVELPESGVRGGFRAGAPVPYMERNLLAGVFHAAASLGIAESADAIARRGVAGRINGDARPRMQVADNAVDPSVLRAGSAFADRRAELGLTQRDIAGLKIMGQPALVAFRQQGHLIFLSVCAAMDRGWSLFT